MKYLPLLLVLLVHHAISSDCVTRLKKIDMKFFDAIGKPSSGISRGNLKMYGDYDMCRSMANHTPCKTKSGKPSIPLLWTHCLPDECAANPSQFTEALADLINSTLDVVTLDAVNEFIDSINDTYVDWATKLAIKAVIAANYDSVVTTIEGVVDSLDNMPGLTVCEVEEEPDAGVIIAWIVISIILTLTTLGTVWGPVSLFVYNVKELLVLSNMRTSHSPTLPCRDRDGEPGLVIENDYSDVKELGGTLQLHDVPLQEVALQDNPVVEIHQVGVKPVPNPITLESVLQCFALQKNIPVLFDTSAKGNQVLCLNGIRVLSISWVVLCHIYFVPLMANAGDIAQADAKSKIAAFELILNGFPAVDSFFLLSGFLVTYLLLKEFSKERPFNVAAFYLHRYIRLTIPFGVVMLMEGWLYPYYTRGPNSDIFAKTKAVCRKYWWANLLYINNFVPSNNSKLENGICVGQTWYLSNDFQFFAVAPLFIFLLYKRPKLGVTLCTVCIVISMSVSGYLTGKHNLGSTNVQNGITPGFDIFWDYYIKPYVRIVPYMIGVLGGWVYYKKEQFIRGFDKGSVLLKTGVALPIWVLSILVQCSVVFGVHQDTKEFFAYDKAKQSTVPYNTFSKLAWSTALLTQILTCQAGLGGVVNTLLSWRGWLPLSRLTYSIYLLHYGLNMVLVGELRHGWSFQTDYNMAVMYMGLLCMTHAVSAALFLTVEQPIKNLESITYRKR